MKHFMKKLKKDEPKKYEPQMTKETKQTALEQFAIALYEKGLLIGNGDWMQDVLQEFKKMDIQQKIEISKNSYIAGYLDNQSKIDDSMNFPDDYINELYGEQEK